MVEKPVSGKGCAIYRDAELKKLRFLLWKKKMKKNDKK
jgi:hypothetical protein